MGARAGVRWVLIVAAGAGMLPAGGCIVAAGAAAGYGAYEYVNGEYTGVVGAPLDRAWRATLATLDQMGATVRSKARERAGGTIRASRTDGTSIQIELSIQSGDFTRLTIRIGVLGDERASRALVAKIKENL